MQLKLAEYNLETGKFERFLELGADDGFAYCGDYIFATWLRPEHELGEDYASYYLKRFDKDEKDPLNRFNGLFDGITYGDGRFILIINNNPRIMDKIVNF